MSNTNLISDLNNLHALFQEEAQQREAQYRKQVNNFLEKSGFPRGTQTTSNLATAVRFITEDKGGHEIAIDVNFASTLISIPTTYSHVAYVQAIPVERIGNFSGVGHFSLRRFVDTKPLAVPYNLYGRTKIKVSVEDAPYVVKQLAEYVKNENLCG